MSILDGIVARRQRVIEQRDEIYALKNKIFNHHCYDITIDGIKLAYKIIISKESIDSLMKDCDNRIEEFNKEISKIEEELKEAL